jgi:hypothetical protein
MKKNIGTTDKSVRIIIAIIIAVLVYMNVIIGALAIGMLVVAVVLLITSITGFCGLYKVFGIHTCKLKEKK